MIHIKKQNSENSLKAIGKMLYNRHHCGYGLAVLLCTLFVLSIFAGINYENKPQLYIAGTVAEMDVVAHRDLLVEDELATNAQREKLRQAQPLVFDLDLTAFETFNTEILSLFNEILGLTYGEEAHAMRRLEDALTPEIAEDVLVQLARPNVQTYMLSHLLPNVQKLLNRGLVRDMRAARVGEGGAVIRDVESGTETLRPNVTSLPDVQSTLVQLGSVIRNDPVLDPPARRTLIILLSAYLPASLSLNKELTNERADAVVAHVDPVYYTLHRGEMVVRKGDLVTREQQAKLQTIYNSVGTWIHLRFSMGLFLLSALISFGLFMAPSGKPGTPLRHKDYIFMACLLTSCTLAAKATYVIGSNSGEAAHISLLAYGFPVAGIVGIVATVFAARRYCTMSLLLALFTTVMFKGDIALFFYYFLGGMLATLLVTRAQNRQDVVWSILPLLVGQIFFWLAVALYLQTPFAHYPWQLVAVAVNSVASLLMLFAFSPVLELAFAYTTRFRLMEFMSLEHPLMQEMMVSMPGTYHHSLIVANMVEAGAKAIGANSLLCKVGALYHDVGKLSHADYFIENQFGGQNKHDKLSPSMSALILTSHVKKGAELAEKYKLGTEIADIITQHHGTRVISFFYYKAQKMGENVRESDYSYPGPRPQTKEAAILMLADSVEASSRTLNDPTPARLKTHIDTIMKSIFSEGQLDESSLTFKDLHKISEQFLHILTGLFHQRIAYPSGNAKDANKENKEERGTDKNAGLAPKPIDTPSQEETAEKNEKKTSVEEVTPIAAQQKENKSKTALAG